ncbi:LppU/SCO3897 family protein [Mycobacteroides abscessus]
MQSKLIACCITVFAATACGTSQPGADVSTAPNFDQITGQYPEQPAGIPGEAIAPIGSCVSLEGPREKPSLKVVDCGSPANGYKVIQRVSMPDQCVKDAEQRFYLDTPDGGFAACLDYAWSTKDCLSIGKVSVVRAACNDNTAPRREKPISIVYDTQTAGVCPTGGFAHPIRRFTICTEPQH